MILGPPLLFMILYVWSRRNPQVPVSVWGTCIACPCPFPVPRPCLGHARHPAPHVYCLPRGSPVTCCLLLVPPPRRPYRVGCTCPLAQPPHTLAPWRSLALRCAPLCSPWDIRRRTRVPPSLCALRLRRCAWCSDGAVRRVALICRRQPGLPPFYGVYLPWLYLAFSLLLGANPVPDLMGIAAGHIYYFLQVRSHAPLPPAPCPPSPPCTPAETRAAARPCLNLTFWVLVRLWNGARLQRVPPPTPRCDAVAAGPPPAPSAHAPPPLPHNYVQGSLG
jgi:hypothetical protein